MGTERKPKKPQKIQRLSVVDQVSDSIKQSIMDKVWQEGDKLPSEGELADYYGVNRLSVRMALQKLSTLGLIETRVGEGSFVAHFSMGRFLCEIASFYDTQERRMDVEQLRNLLEGECTTLAIMRATPEDMARLKERLDDCNRCAELYNQDLENRSSLRAAVAADFAFHYEIICMSHNQLYMDIYMMIQQLIFSHIQHLIYTRSHKRRDHNRTGLHEADLEATHDKIYNSILNGDAAQAKCVREQMLGVVPAHNMDYFDDYLDLPTETQAP